MKIEIEKLKELAPQRALAKMMGISQASLSRYYNGHTPSPTVMDKIEKFLIDSYQVIEPSIDEIHEGAIRQEIAEAGGDPDKIIKKINNYKIGSSLVWALVCGSVSAIIILFLQNL